MRYLCFVVIFLSPASFQMRKYRFGDANGAAGWLKRTNIVYFVLAWNAFGICAYQWWKSRRTKEHKEWNQLTQGLFAIFYH